MKGIIFFAEEEIVLVLVERGVNRTVVVRQLLSQKYCGMRMGEFENPTELGNIFSELITASGVKFDKVFIATPSYLCEVTADEIAIDLKGKKVTQAHMEQLLNSVGLSEGDNIVISKTAVYFKVDNGSACINPIGQAGSALIAKISLISVPHSFVDVIKSEMVTIVPSVEFVPVTLATALHLIPSSSRDSMCVLINNEQYSTTVSVVAGDGIIKSTNVDMGSYHVANDLCVVKKIDKPIAIELLRHVVLGLVGEKAYDFSGRQFPTEETNAIISSRIEVIAEGVLKAINQSDQNLLDGEIFLMGEINAIRGARNLLSKELGSNIVPLKCPRLNVSGTLDLLIGSVAQLVL